MENKFKMKCWVPKLKPELHVFYSFKHFSKCVYYLFMNAYHKHWDTVFFYCFRPPVIRVSDKVMIPQDDHPDINFVGLLIGPRGNTLKNLEKEVHKLNKVVHFFLDEYYSFINLGYYTENKI